MRVMDYLEGMDYQKKDNALYGVLVVMILIAIGIAMVGTVQAYYMSLLVTAVVGLVIAVHIHNEKKASSGVTCPIGENCYEVITSKYSIFLGISVEVYGILYYLFIIAGYIVALLFAVPEWFTFFILANTAMAVLFSAYLTFIQAVPLGKWCIWCVTSAICCIAIFGLALLGLSQTMAVSALLAQFTAITGAVYFFGIALGMGVAITTDILLLDFLRDFEMSERQATTINHLSEVMWAALAIIVLGGAGYFYPQIDMLGQAVNVVSGLALGVIILNGSLLYLFFSHKLEKIHFEKKEEDAGDDTSDEAAETDASDENVARIRRGSFVLTGVSTTSWITLFFLTFAEIPAGVAALSVLLPAYGALLSLGVAFGLATDIILQKSARGELKSNIPLLFD